MSPRGGATAVTDLTGRIRVRRRGRWRRRLVLALIPLLAVALIAGGVWLVGFSPVFAVAKVDVVGIKTLTADEVRAAAKVPLGRPLARLDTKAIAERVRQVPQVADVFVRAKLPNHVEIAVTERTPVMVLAVPGALRLVDGEGRAYVTVAKPPAGIPTGEVLNAQDPANPDPTLVRDLAVVAGALPAAWKSGTMSTRSRDTITLAVNQKVVFFGSSDDAPLKADVAQKLMSAVPKAGTYDVSSPAHPVTR